MRNISTLVVILFEIGVFLYKIVSKMEQKRNWQTGNRFFRKSVSDANNKLIESNKELIRVNEEKPWYKKPETILSVILSIVAILQTYYISQQQQRIEGFDLLLKNSNAQTEKLIGIVDGIKTNNEQTALVLQSLDDQLKYVQSSSNVIAQQSYAQDKKDFQELLRSYSYLSSTGFIAEMARVDKEFGTGRQQTIGSLYNTLNNEINNQFLVNNESIKGQWQKLYREVKTYHSAYNAYRDRGINIPEVETRFVYEVRPIQKEFEKFVKALNEVIPRVKKEKFSNEIDLKPTDEV